MSSSPSEPASSRYAVPLSSDYCCEQSLMWEARGYPHLAALWAARAEKAPCDLDSIAWAIKLEEFFGEHPDDPCAADWPTHCERTWLQRACCGRGAATGKQCGRTDTFTAPREGRRVANRTRHPGHRRVAGSRGPPWDDDPPAGDSEPPRRRPARYSYACIPRGVRAC